MLENNNIEQLNNEKVSENEQSSQENSQENSQVNSQQQNSFFDEEAIRKLIQSEVDKVRGKYSLELKKKDDELKKLRAEHLTAEEVTKLEIAEQKLAIEEQKKELEEQRREINYEKNKNFAKDSIAKAKLCPNTEKALRLVNSVMGDSEEEIEANIKNIAEVIEDIVSDRVDGLYKSNGRQVTRTSGNAGLSNNPWAKDSMNLTEQMKIQINNPELAKKLMAQANLIP